LSAKENDMNQHSRRRSLIALLGLPIGLTAATAHARSESGPAADELTRRLDALESREQITGVLYAYARGNDRKDEALLRSCFWPQSTHKHGGFDGTSKDFIDFALKIIRSLKFSAHHISNVSIELNADRALSECHYFAHHRRAAKEGGGEEDAFFEGRYVDLFERRNGVWKVIRRRGLADFSTVVAASRPFAEWPEAQRSRDFPDDDYYSMLAGLRGAAKP
jgi:hypothetical protein